MGPVFELVVGVLLGWVPERPQWEKWLVLGVYIALICSAVALSVSALV